MADSIKIGSLDISAFRVGQSDCKVYLGSTLLYPQSQPQTLQWVEYVSGDTIPSDLDIYGISGTAYNLQSAFGLGDPIYMDLSRNKVTINVDHSCYYEEDIPKDDIVRIIFSDYTCSDYYNQAATVRFPIQLYINSSPTPPTPTSYTYSVTIQGLENGDTTTIWWDASRDIHTDSNVGNGTYTYTTTTDDIVVQLDTSGLSDYTVDHAVFWLYSGGSQTVTFTYQGGGGGLVNIPQGTNMEQYYGRTITRFKIGDPSLPSGFQMLNFGFQKGGSGGQISSWGTNFTFDSTWVQSLPCDVSGSDELTSWLCFDSSWATSPINPFTDLWIEFA